MKLYTNITENCKNTIERSSRTFAASFSVGETKYTDIKSLKILVPSAFNGKVGIGGTISNSVEIISGKIKLTSGTVIKAYESVLLDSGEYEDVPMGKYRITSAVTKDSLTTIKAEGPLSTETGLGYFSNLEYPATTIQMLNEISDAINVPIIVDGLEEIYIDSKPEGYTYREVIGYLAAVHGTNAAETRDGSIALKWYEHCEEDIFTDRADSPDINNELFVVGKLECTTSSECIVRGDGKTGIAINNPLVTENIADIIWNKIGGFTYRAATFNVKLGNPCVDIWDCFSYKDDTVIATELQYVHDGGLQNVYKSVGESETSANGAKGPVTKQMERYWQELVFINEALVNKLSVDQLDAVEANITSAVIGTIDGRYATFEYLSSNYINTTVFEAISGRVGTLEANALTADSAVIKNLESEITKTNTLIFGSGSGTSIQTEFSNSVIAQLGDAQIKSAMIENITTAQILAGDISTNKHRIISDSGNMILSDNTMQISDGTRVRVQIGKDASADYNLYVWDKAGNLMFDALGLTESGITRQIIRDDVVKDDANISASKLNIDSLFNVINEDGSNTLKSSKIYLDDKGQTLDVAFLAMSTNVSDLQTTQASQGTQISTIQGQITSKIWQEDINTAVDDVEGNVSALSTQYTTLSQSVSGISIAVGNHTSQIGGLETRAESAETNYAQLSDKFNWIVASGTSATDFTLTDRMATLTAQYINLNGLVKFSGLASDAQAEINTAKNNASSALATANTANTNAANAVSTANNALAGANSSVKSITIHYLATSASSGVTTSTSGWTTTPQEITSTKKYLWTYQTITTVSGSTTNTTPVISGVYGDKGATGSTGATGNGISKVVSLYYLKSNTTAPSAPTSAVTSTSTSTGVWTTAIPTYVRGYTYFTCMQTLYTSGKYGWSAVVADNAFTNANKIAVTANTTASNALSTANAVDSTIANWCYNNDRTYINGGKIYTGTIAAKQINVSDLFAQNITATGTITGATLNGATLNGGQIYLEGSEAIGSAKFRITDQSAGRYTLVFPNGIRCFNAQGETTAMLIGGFGIALYDYEEDGTTLRSRSYISTYDIETPKISTKKVSATETITAGGEIISTSANAFRCAYGSYGAILRVDGVNFYILLTNQGEAETGAWNSFRPLTINLASGTVQFGHDVAFSSNARIANSRSFAAYGTNGTAYSLAKMTSDNIIQYGNGSPRTQIMSTSRIDFLTGGVTSTSSRGISITYDNGYPYLRPTLNGQAYLGSSSLRWAGIFSTTSVSVSSDRRLKSDINNLDDRYLALAKVLSAKSYFLNMLNDDKRHVGYIAQDVEQAMLSVGLTAQDCGFVSKDWVEREDYTGYEYSLNYEEIHTMCIASLQREMNELKEELLIAKAKIEYLQLQQPGT